MPAIETQPLRGRLPAIAPAQAEALRVVFGEPRSWRAGDGGRLRFMPGSPPTRAEAFTVEADGVSLRLRLDGVATAGDLRWSDHRGRARLLAWSLAHERPLMVLSEALGTSLLPVEDAGNAAAADTVWLAFATESGDATTAATRGVLGLPGDWLDRLGASAEPVYEDDPLPELGAWLSLPLPATVCLSGPELPSEQWRKLHPGDVVVIARGRAPAAEARAGGQAWPLAAMPSGWRIEGAPRILSIPQESASMNATGSESAVAESEGDDAATTDDHPARSLPVQLAFDIGQLELSVGELAALQPGYVFALPTRLEGANVGVRANGRLVGRGELVAVGDTLGVRLVSWH